MEEEVLMTKLIAPGLVLILFIFLLVFGCSSPIPMQEQIAVEPPVQEAKVEIPAVSTEDALEDTSDLPVNLSCTLTADCESGKQCIDGQCGTIEALYTTDCASTCNFEEVIISTSDGETYTLGKGQGSYTAAGALEWKLLSVPNYCTMEKVIVPLRIIAKNYGRVLGEHALTLREGETSPAITHPAIPDIEFTVTLNRVVESCG